MARGFTILAPEELTLPEQAAAFAEAEVVAGFAGSGMFHVASAPRARTVLAVASDTYHASNEILLGSLLDLRVAISRSHSAVVTQQITSKSFHSDFEVDLESSEPVARPGPHKLAAWPDRFPDACRSSWWARCTTQARLAIRSRHRPPWIANNQGFGAKVWISSGRATSARAAADSAAVTP